MREQPEASVLELVSYSYSLVFPGHWW